MLDRIDAIVWGPGLLFLILGTGIYLMVKLKFLPLRRLGMALKLAIGFNKEKGKHVNGSVSSFSALMTELAATIGTGNIVGVATAMSLGGPGALFWMIISSLIGMALKLVESTLAVTYRQRNQRGQLAGGPMYVMENGLKWKKTGHIMAVVYAFLAVLASFGMGNMVQANSIADAVYVTFGISKITVGFIIALLTLFVVFGGIRTIGKLTNILVPIMGILYLSGTLIVIIFHWRNLFEAIQAIFLYAFCPKAITGGILGTSTSGALQAFRWGVSRGVFSNEAGLGASGISAAAANTSDAVRQGYISMTGVFFDTIVICTSTGLALLVSGAFQNNVNEMEGSVLTLRAFETVFGDKGEKFVCISIVLFAFATIIAWAYQGEKAYEFLMHDDKKSNSLIFRLVYILFVIIGCIFSLRQVWNLSDICNGLLAIPNIVCVLILSNRACAKILAWDKDFNMKCKM